MQDPNRPEIDQQTLKLMVGVVATTLGTLTNAFSTRALDSISASYWEGGWAQTIFLGFLFAIAAFLVAYNGYSKGEMILAKVAALAAVCVALFPCNCVVSQDLKACAREVGDVPLVHGGAAGVLFIILIAFCLIFYKRAGDKKQRLQYPEAQRRQWVYLACAVVIAVASLAMGLNYLLALEIRRLVWYGETAGLIAFGISWLTASRYLPYLANPAERPLAKAGKVTARTV